MCEIVVGIPWCWWVGPKDRGCTGQTLKRAAWWQRRIYCREEEEEQRAEQNLPRSRAGGEVSRARGAMGGKMSRIYRGAEQGGEVSRLCSAEQGERGGER